MQAHTHTNTHPHSQARTQFVDKPVRWNFTFTFVYVCAICSTVNKEAGDAGWRGSAGGALKCKCFLDLRMKCRELRLRLHWGSGGRLCQSSSQIKQGKMVIYSSLFITAVFWNAFYLGPFHPFFLSFLRSLLLPRVHTINIERCLPAWGCNALYGWSQRESKRYSDRNSMSFLRLSFPQITALWNAAEWKI